MTRKIERGGPGLLGATAPPALAVSKKGEEEVDEELFTTFYSSQLPAEQTKQLGSRRTTRVVALLFDQQK